MFRGAGRLGREMNDRLGRVDIHGSSRKIHVISSRGHDTNVTMCMRCMRNSNIIWVQTPF